MTTPTHPRDATQTEPKPLLGRRRTPTKQLLVTMFLILPRLRQMIYAYPTFHRAIEGALGDLSE